jgi:hypothetical protein
MDFLSTGFLGVVLLMGGQVGLPLGLPPLSEDPVLSRVAPDDCLLYFSWSGVAEPDAKSKNQTEQMLAEPEMKQFIETVGKALGAAIRKGAPATPQGQVLGQNGPKLIRALFTHRAAIVISKIEIGPHGPNVLGGAIINAGDDTEELKTALETIEKVLSPANAAATQKWHRLPTPTDGPQFDWAFQDKYLIIGVGPGMADSIAVRATSNEVKTPEWLAALKRKLPVERVSTVFYLNANKARQAAAPLLGEPDFKAMLEALGIANIRSIAAVSGLEGAGCLSKTWIETDAEPSGLLGVFGPEPLKAADLATIPKDASFAAAARMNLSKLFDAAVEGSKKVRPDAPVAELAKIEAMLGFELKKDLLDTLGDTWCVYNSPGEGGLLVTGLTIVAPVKDRDRLAKTNDRLLELARVTAGPASPTIKETKFRGERIFYLSGAGNDSLPFLPAWCISDTHLILSLSPQNIRAFLARDRTSGSLADLPAVADRLKSSDAVALAYQDTAGMLKITYPVMQILVTLGFSEIGREGIDLDSSVLPSLASIVRHVEPGVGVLVREKKGLVYTSRQSLPVNMSVPILFEVATFFGFEMPIAAPIPQPAADPLVQPQAVPVDRASDSPPAKSADLTPKSDSASPPKKE